VRGPCGGARVPLGCSLTGHHSRAGKCRQKRGKTRPTTKRSCSSRPLQRYAAFPPGHTSMCLRLMPTSPGFWTGGLQYQAAVPQTGNRSAWHGVSADHRELERRHQALRRNSHPPGGGVSFPVFLLSGTRRRQPGSCLPRLPALHQRSGDGTWAADLRVQAWRGEAMADGTGAQPGCVLSSEGRERDAVASVHRRRQERSLGGTPPRWVRGCVVMLMERRPARNGHAWRSFNLGFAFILRGGAKPLYQTSRAPPPAAAGCRPPRRRAPRRPGQPAAVSRWLAGQPQRSFGRSLARRRGRTACRPPLQLAARSSRARAPPTLSSTARSAARRAPRHVRPRVLVAPS
jgi:hypothetical protein